MRDMCCQPLSLLGYVHCSNDSSACEYFTFRDDAGVLRAYASSGVQRDLNSQSADG